MSLLRLAFVTCGFLGLAPVAPGTFGTLGGVLIAYLLAPTRWFGVWILLLALLLYAVARRLGPWAEARAGRKDPGFFVIDEVIGYMITVAWTRGPSLFALLVAFALFRLFDVWKPAPVRRLEAVGGGDGILLDDVMAGLYGLLVMTLLRLFVGEGGLWDYDPSRWPFGG